MNGNEIGATMPDSIEESQKKAIEAEEAGEYVSNAGVLIDEGLLTNRVAAALYDTNISRKRMAIRNTKQDIESEIENAVEEIVEEKILEKIEKSTGVE